MCVRIGSLLGAHLMVRKYVLGKFGTEALKFMSRTQNLWNEFALSHAHQLRRNFKRVLVTQATKLYIDQNQSFFVDSIAIK
jgi:hypothetical protein